MRLSQFITANMESILAEFVEFARSHTAAGRTMAIGSLRDHAAGMLAAIALDMEQPQSAPAQTLKSRGDAPVLPESPDTAAELHGAARAVSGFSLDEMLAEYRALRASVLRLWLRGDPRLGREDLDDLIRFDEGIDQALAEAITRYSTDLAESREMFLAILGHDLRTPLGAVFTAATFLMEEGELTGPNLRLATRIRRSSDRMNSLVRDLLDFTQSRLGGGGIPITRADIDLGAVVHEAMDEVRSQDPALDIRYEQRGDLHGSWDGKRVSQALANLIGNAVQHGAETAPIRVQAIGLDDEALVTVHNFGPVIPPENQPRLFDPYKRLLAGGGRAASGSMGLGLFIAQEIAIAHAGRIHVDSSMEQGTTFTLRLPRRAPGAKDA
jgi:signal transduction histidine kinase